MHETNASGADGADHGHRHAHDLVARLKYELVPMKSIERAIDELPARSTVSVTCSPAKGISATIELTDRLRRLGHTAVPHLAARMVESEQHVRAIAGWLRSEHVGNIFLVGGDANPPHGPFADASAFLAALLDADPALSSIGVTAYPDGHPAIDAAVCRRALHHKQRFLAEAGIAAYASTQMCFDPERIVGWLGDERAAGLTLPIHLGIPGVVDRTKLMTMGVRLGVGTSLRYLRKNRATVGRLIGGPSFDPASLLEPLGPVLEPLGITGLHCFTFNQVATTVDWQRQVLGER